MAQKKSVPSKTLPGGPPAPVAMPEMPRYQKRSGYSPEQSDHDAYCSFYDRGVKTETPSSLSPGPPSKGWGRGSYDERGRPLQEGGGEYGGQKVSAGPHTRGGPGKASRPGRW